MSFLKRQRFYKLCQFLLYVVAFELGRNTYFTWLVELFIHLRYFGVSG